MANPRPSRAPANTPKGSSASWKKRGCVVGFVLLVTLLITAGIAAWTAEKRYGALFAAPSIDHAELTTLHPQIRIAIDPSKVSKQIQQAASKIAGRDVPAWLVAAFLPHSVSLIMDADHDTGNVHISFLLNERRLGPFLTRQMNLIEITGFFPEIEWPDESVTLQRRGVILIEGSVPMEPEAKEEAWFNWSHTLLDTPLELEGGHLLEAVADNREGSAWLAGSSLMTAYNYDLDAHAKDVTDGVSRASFKFITEIRLVADLVGDNALSFRLTLEVIEEHRHKLAVINLKVFLEDLLNELGRNLDEYHGIQFKGYSEWDENTLVIEYQLDDVVQTLELIASGRLFRE